MSSWRKILSWRLLDDFRPFMIVKSFNLYVSVDETSNKFGILKFYTKEDAERVKIVIESTPRPPSYQTITIEEDREFLYHSQQYEKLVEQGVQLRILPGGLYEE